MIKRVLMEYELNETEVETAIREYIERRDGVELSSPRYVMVRARNKDKGRPSTTAILLVEVPTP